MKHTLAAARAVAARGSITGPHAPYMLIVYALSATKPRIIGTPEVLALSPERGAVPRIVAAVPERIQGRHIGRGELVADRYPGPGRDDPAGRVAGDAAGEVAWEVTGEVTGAVNGVAAGVIAAGDGGGPLEVAAVVAGAGDDGANDPLLNGGRCAVMATMR